MKQPSAAGQHRTNDGQVLLEGLSRLVSHSASDRSQTTIEMLRLITTQFGLRTSYVAKLTPERGEQLSVASHNEPGGCDMAVGSVSELLNTF